MNMIAPRRTRLVLVGNGMAGVRALEEILQRAPGEFAITVFGAEPHGMLQPHHAVAGAGRRKDLRGHHHPSAGVV